MGYTKLVKALRCKRDDCEGCDLAFFDKDEGWMCQYAAKDDDAADAIEALQDTVQAQDKALKECARQLAKMGPKRGEWIDDEFGAKCSYCGKYAYWSKFEIPWKSPYCPLCGAKMEVQDENISKFADGEWWKEAQDDKV